MFEQLEQVIASISAFTVSVLLLEHYPILPSRFTIPSSCGALERNLFHSFVPNSKRKRKGLFGMFAVLSTMWFFLELL